MKTLFIAIVVATVSFAAWSSASAAASISHHSMDRVEAAIAAAE